MLTVGFTLKVLLLPEIGVHEYPARPAGAVKTIVAPSGILPVEEVYEVVIVAEGSELTVCKTEFPTIVKP